MLGILLNLNNVEQNYHSIGLPHGSDNGANLGIIPTGKAKRVKKTILDCFVLLNPPGTLTRGEIRNGGERAAP